MEWFGWLTKPHMLVTVLDRFIFTGELLTALVITFFAWAIVLHFQGKLK